MLEGRAEDVPAFWVGVTLLGTHCEEAERRAVNIHTWAMALLLLSLESENLDFSLGCFGVLSMVIGPGLPQRSISLLK